MSLPRKMIKDLSDDELLTLIEAGASSLHYYIGKEGVKDLLVDMNLLIELGSELRLRNLTEIDDKLDTLCMLAARVVVSRLQKADGLLTVARTIQAGLSLCLRENKSLAKVSTLLLLAKVVHTELMKEEQEGEVGFLTMVLYTYITELDKGLRKESEDEVSHNFDPKRN